MIPTVKYKEKISKLKEVLSNDTGIDDFCLCILEESSNKKYFLSSMPKWAQEYHQIGGARSDEVFCPEKYTLPYMFPREKKYDFIQGQLVNFEERFKHYDTYSIIRKTGDITFIALALHKNKVRDCNKIYAETIRDFEKFIVNFILEMKNEMFESCDFIEHYNYLYRADFLLKVISSQWKEETSFTKSELKIMSSIYPQYTVKKIAFDIGMSESTCRNHIQKIKDKMGVFSFDDFIKLSTVIMNQ